MQNIIAYDVTDYSSFQKQIIKIEDDYVFWKYANNPKTHKSKLYHKGNSSFFVVNGYRENLKNYMRSDYGN